MALRCLLHVSQERQLHVANELCKITCLKLLSLPTALGNITDHNSHKAMQHPLQRAVCMRCSHSSHTCLLASEHSLTMMMVLANIHVSLGLAAVMTRKP